MWNPIAGALVREDQAELQIATYVRGLAEALRAAGGQVFEGTTVTHVGAGSRPTVRTAGGAKVRAHDVVVVIERRLHTLTAHLDDLEVGFLGPHPCHP